MLVQSFIRNDHNTNMRQTPSLENKSPTTVQQPQANLAFNPTLPKPLVFVSQAVYPSA
jgi:hypothetical protein